MVADNHMTQPTYKVFGELKNVISQYADQIEIIEGLYFNQKNVLRMCEFYSNSRYLKADQYGNYSNTDALGRDKPFYNIVNYRVALAKTATDLDIKDIQVVSDNPQHSVMSMFLNKEIYEWMKEADFSSVLNKMGATRPKYGGYLVKKTEAKGKLTIDVVDWKNVYTDQVEILGGPIVETHYMSPVELKSMDGVWENVNDVLEANKKIKNKDKSFRITVYEVNGELPKSVFNDADSDTDIAKDAWEFSLQKYFIAEVGGKDYLLYHEEKKGKITDTYMYLPWEEMPGRGLGKGVIEDSEEAQVWTNDSVVNEKNAMDLAGKVVLKTNSKKLANNVLEIDNGKIFQLEDGKDINSFNLVPAALGQFQNQIEKWKTQADNVTSSFEAATGQQPPSGTPYSQTALLNQVAMKPFDYKRQEWGIHLGKIVDEWIMPYLIKQLYKGHTLRADYTDKELELIDRDFATHKVNGMIFDHIMATGIVPSPQDQAGATDALMQGMKKHGKSRFIKFPKGYFDDWEGNCTVITTGEQKNKAAILTSLSSIMDTVIKSYNPQTGKFGVFEDPRLVEIFSTIVEMSGAGLSPVSLGLDVKGQTGQQAAPVQATAPAPAMAQSAPLAPTQ